MSRLGAADDGAPMTISGEQCKAARELLAWPLKTLAGKCKPSEGTIRYFENGTRRPSSLNVLLIRRALEVAGVEFTEGQPGVKLRKAKP
jgi:ribosome-binding protein aMBF1 (putative translation factor)